MMMSVDDPKQQPHSFLCTTTRCCRPFQKIDAHLHHCKPVDRSIDPTRRKRSSTLILLPSLPVVGGKKGLEQEKKEVRSKLPRPTPTSVPMSVAEDAAMTTASKTTTKTDRVMMNPVRGCLLSDDRDCKMYPQSGGWERKKAMISEPFASSPLSYRSFWEGVLKCKIQKKGLDHEEDVLGYEEGMIFGNSSVLCFRQCQNAV